MIGFVINRRRFISRNVGILLEEAFKDLELRFQLEWTVLENSVEAELQTQRAAVEREV